MKQLRSSTDVWFIAFLIKNEYEIDRYDVIDRGRIKCFFAIPEEEWKTLKLQFSTSDIAEYKNIIEKIKDLAY